MNGCVLLVVLTIVAMSADALTLSRDKRDAHLDNFVRALEKIVERSDGEGQDEDGEADTYEGPTLKELAHRLKALEDRLFLARTISVAGQYGSLCADLMLWLHHHWQAYQMAQNSIEAGTPTETPTSSKRQQIKRLLKKVLVRMERADSGATSATSGGNSTEVGMDESMAETSMPDSEQASDESDESVAKEERLVKWGALMGSCYIWTVMAVGQAPDFPSWLPFTF